MGEAGRVVPATHENRIEELVAWWTQSTRLWRQELGTPCDEAVCWQPFNKSHSIGAILLHLADVEGRWIEEFLNGKARPADELDLLRSETNRPHQGAWVDPPEWPFNEYVELLGWIRNRSLATLRRFCSPDYEFEGPRGNTTIREAVQFLCFHEAYHAGQAVLHRVHFEWGGIEPG